MENIMALLPRFVERTASEEKVLQYEFTIDGSEVFCREAYQDADGVLTHLTNVKDLLTEMLKYADLFRLELHGPELEIDKLRGPLADLDPAFFVRAAGLER
jgi:hypothetical protein